MSGATLLFAILGAMAAIAGLAMLVTALRGTPGETPRHTVLLIAGMMTTAFGLLMLAFAIGSASSTPSYGEAQ